MELKRINLRPARPAAVRAAFTRAGIALGIAACCAAPAFADLGGAPRLPAQASRGTSALTSASPSTRVREVTGEDGLVEREYVGADGMVFAVAWRGRREPHLSELLGKRYAAQLSQDARTLRRRGKGSRTMTSQAGSAFAVQTMVRQRFSTGVAWLPALLPAGLDPKTLAVRADRPS